MSNNREQFITYIISGVAAFLLSVFLPRTVQTAVREILKFIVRAIFTSWYFTVPATILLIALMAKGIIHLGGILFFLLVISIILLAGIIQIIRLYKKSYSRPNIALYGCYTVKNNEYLQTDIDAELINQKLIATIEQVKNHYYSFSKGVIDINFITLPKFLPLVMGSSWLERFIRRRLFKGRHIAALYFIRQPAAEGLQIFLHWNNDGKVDAEFGSNLRILFDNLALDKESNSVRKAEIITRLYMLVSGQMFLDFFLHAEKYKEVHYILDDSQQLLHHLHEDLHHLTDKGKKALEPFLQFWTGYLHRYRAVALIEQGELYAAVDQIFSAIRLAPYYPYLTYKELRADFQKKYAIDYSVSLKGFLSEGEATPEDLENVDKVAKELTSQVRFPYATFHDSIVREILQRSSSDEIVQKIENAISGLDQNDPFQLLLQADILKYTKKGEEKINSIYVQRIDQCVMILRRVIELDSTFSLIKTKIGTLLFWKGTLLNETAVFDEGMRYWKDGMHFFSELGFEYRTK